MQFSIIAPNFCTLKMPNNIGIALFIANAGIPFCTLFWGNLIHYLINPTGK
jgi:hypothetical protein